MKGLIRFSSPSSFSINVSTKLLYNFRITNLKLKVTRCFKKHFPILFFFVFSFCLKNQALPFDGYLSRMSELMVLQRHHLIETWNPKFFHKGIFFIWEVYNERNTNTNLNRKFFFLHSSNLTKIKFMIGISQGPFERLRNYFQTLRRKIFIRKNYCSKFKYFFEKNY